MKNPYRYRGYRYDTETGLHYLQSRYYSPEWGRFINADDVGGQVGDLLTHNLFAYCKNNPVNNFDPDGHWSIRSIFAEVEVIAVAAVATFIAVKLVTDAVVHVVVNTIEDTVSSVRTFARSKTKTKADTKTKTVANTNTNNKAPTYLRAKATHPGAEVYVDQPLDLKSAKMILDIGGDVYAHNAVDAEALCMAVGGGFTGPTNDGNPLSAMHYHPLSYAARGHIFFGQDPNLKSIPI